MRLALAVILLSSTLVADQLNADARVRVNPLPSRQRNAATATPQRPTAEQLRSAILERVPSRPQAVRALAAGVTDPLPTGYALSYRGNGTPRQIRPSEAARRSSAASEAAFREPLESARAFLRENRELLRIDNPDREFVAGAQAKDALGGTDIRFTQQWNGIPVWPAEVIVHLDARGQVELLEGAYAPSPRRIMRSPVVDATEAAARVRSSNATVGQPVLIVHSRGGRRPRLAWKMTVTESMAAQWTVVVDAMNGAILQRFSNIQTAAATGTGIDLSGATRQLRLWRDGANYYMVDTSKQMFDAASAPPDPSKTRGAIFVSDFSNGEETFSLVASTNPNAWGVRDSVSAAFWLSQTYDYFLERHNRDSIDGNKGALTAAVRFRSGYQNAFWYDEQQLMVFGDGATFAASLDVIPHELTHGVTSHSANLVYEGQSGAINEAMSDIFGEMAEADFYGSNDWLMGTSIGGPIRSLSNPGSFGDPGKMSEFRNTTEDNGGVHTNSGIINRAFYLLAAGMPGAIGRGDAERIFYRALTQHLTKDSQFIDARVAAITSAEELFGASSTQARKTAEAFDGVEIFAQGQAPGEPTIPVVNAADSTLFIFNDGTDWQLARREGNDDAAGVQVLDLPLAETRPAVTGDGTVAVFVTEDRDVCLFATSAQFEPECLDLPAEGIFVSSVGMSPDGSRFGFVLFGEDGDPENQIIVIEEGDGTAYDLSAPVFDGETFSAVEYADLMTFTADGQFLVYDALNVVSTAFGDYSAWSIYALDLETSDVFSIIPVIEGLDVGFPALGRTSDDLLTFEAYDSTTDESQIFSADLASGDANVIAIVETVPTSPSYTGDDRAIVFAFPDDGPTGASLARQALAADHITPAGQPALWIDGGAYPVIYRRGSYNGPTTTPGSTGFAATSFSVNEGAAATISVTRAGGNKGPLTVSYATSNGTAGSADYTAASGTLSWADGEEGTKTFVVRAATDKLSESNETVQLKLTGSNLGTPSSATLTIVNQAAPSGKRRGVRH